MKLEHPVKSPRLMVSNFSESVTVVRPVQFWNASYCISVTLLGIETVTNEEQRSKAPDPMVVTLSGISIDARLLQPSKARSLMLKTEVPISTDVRLLHPWNVCPSMDVTASGIIIDVRLEQYAKAPSPI